MRSARSTHAAQGQSIVPGRMHSTVKRGKAPAALPELLGLASNFGLADLLGKVDEYCCLWHAM